jgi:dUTP pyrophosphatase
MKIKLLDPRAKVPTVEHPGSDLGYDLYALEDVYIPLHYTVAVRTGIAIEFDDLYGGIIKDRSSMAMHGITVSGGVIDSGYRGEIKVLLSYHGQLEHPYGGIDIHAGDKIAQLVLQKVYTFQEALPVVEEFENITPRGYKGFGSSGR